MGDISGMVDQDGKRGIRMKWRIRIGVGVVDMDEVGLVHMDRDRGVRIGKEDIAYFWKRAIIYKGSESFRNGTYYILYQLWLQ